MILKPRIEAIIPDRDVVLVTHDSQNDSMFMEELGIYLKAYLHVGHPDGCSISTSIDIPNYFTRALDST